MGLSQTRPIPRSPDGDNNQNNSNTFTMIGLDLSEIAHYYLDHAMVLSARCVTQCFIFDGQP